MANLRHPIATGVECRGTRAARIFHFHDHPLVHLLHFLTTFTVVLRQNFYLDPDRSSLQDGLNSDIYFGRAAWETSHLLAYDEENL